MQKITGTGENMEALIKKLESTLKWKKFKYEADPRFSDPPFATQATRDQIQPGAVLKLKDGGIELVGTVNTELGVCDDCTRFDIEDIAEIAYLT